MHLQFAQVTDIFRCGKLEEHSPIIRCISYRDDVPTKIDRPVQISRNSLFAANINQAVGSNQTPRLIHNTDRGFCCQRLTAGHSRDYAGITNESGQLVDHSAILCRNNVQFLCITQVPSIQNEFRRQHHTHLGGWHQHGSVYRSRSFSRF